MHKKQQQQRERRTMKTVLVHNQNTTCISMPKARPQETLQVRKVEATNLTNMLIEKPLLEAIISEQQLPQPLLLSGNSPAAI